MARTLIDQCAFVVTGNYLTNYARELVLEKEWANAISFLRESFEDMSLNQIEEILNGKQHLIGDSNAGIYMEENNDKNYIEKLKDVYLEDLFFENNKLYGFDQIVNIKDIVEIYPVLKKEDIITVIKNTFGCNESVVFTLDEQNWLLAEPVSKNEIPTFFDKNWISETAKKYYQETHKVDQESIPSYKEVKIEDSFEDEENDKLKELRKEEKELYEQIMNACKERNVEWKEFSIELDDGKKYTRKVPMEILKAYCSNRYGSAHYYWKPVSYSGMKMMNDSPFHTDLWLAMGFSLEDDFYDDNSLNCRIFYGITTEYRFAGTDLGTFFKLTNIPMKSFTGNVVNENSKKITDKDILVLPNANLKYESIALKAGVVVVETGSALSHLAIVGKQESLPVILMKDATKLLKLHATVSINFETDKLTEEYI